MTKKEKKEKKESKKEISDLVRDSSGYYDRSDIEQLELEDIIKLLISEQSFQQVINIVRKESVK